MNANTTSGNPGTVKAVRRSRGTTLQSDTSSEVPRIGGVVIGMLAEQTEKGEWLVDHAFATQGSQRARVVTAESLEEGMPVALMFEGGDPGKPLILGPIVGARGPAGEKRRTLELEAEQEIVLRCGAASLTLTEAGKVILRGKYLLSRSSGVNRIKGASVQIN